MKHYENKFHSKQNGKILPNTVNNFTCLNSLLNTPVYIVRKWINLNLK